MFKNKGESEENTPVNKSEKLRGTTPPFTIFLQNSKFPRDDPVYTPSEWKIPEEGVIILGSGL